MRKPLIIKIIVLITFLSISKMMILYETNSLPIDENSNCKVSIEDDSNFKVVWEKTYGGIYPESAFSVVQTKDGGFFLVGITEENYLSTHGDMWVVKTDKEGTMLWNKTYGGSEHDYGFSVIQTSDDGLVIAGVTFGAMSLDMWLVKISTSGTIEWSRNFGGQYYEDKAYSVIQTNDNGFLLVGTTHIPERGQDIIVIKMDSNGFQQWNRTYGGNQDDFGRSVIQTVENDFVVAGITTVRSEGDPRNLDSIILRISNEGDLIWNYTFGGTSNDDAMCIIHTEDDGFLTCGSRGSLPVTSLSLFRDMWLVKTDKNGIMKWNNTYGYTNSTDMSYSVIQTQDQGYLVVGRTHPQNTTPDQDIWIIKTDVNGSMKWNKTYGGRGQDFAYSVANTKDGSYVLAGTLDTGTIENKYFRSNQDMWLSKITFQSNETQTDETQYSTNNTETSIDNNITPSLNIIQVMTMLILIRYLRKKGIRNIIHVK